MTTKIEDHCVKCHDCVDECPNQAIGERDDSPVLVIDPNLCTECVGFYGFEACAAVCPVNACVPGQKEEELVLLRRAEKNHDSDTGVLRNADLEPPCAEEDLNEETSHFRNPDYVAPDSSEFTGENTDRGS